MLLIIVEIFSIISSNCLLLDLRETFSNAFEDFAIQLWQDFCLLIN